MSVAPEPPETENTMATFTSFVGVMQGYGGKQGDQKAGNHFAETTSLLNDRKFQGAGVRYPGTELRLRMIEESGLPPMRVLKASTLAELGRIPRSTEGYAVNALTELRKHGKDSQNRFHSPIVFFSHRWARPNFCEKLGKNLVYGTEERMKAMNDGHCVGDPDDAARTKAKALIEWAKWIVWLTNGIKRMAFHNISEVLFFIDYTCVDQENPLPEIAALPAYVAASSFILSYHNDEYAERAWCRVELAMGYAFAYAGKWPMRLNPGFEHREQRKIRWKRDMLQDPKAGKLTNEEERGIIAELALCAVESKAFTCSAQCQKLIFRGGVQGVVVCGTCLCCACCGLVPFLAARKIEFEKTHVFWRVIE